MGAMNASNLDIMLPVVLAVIRRTDSKSFELWVQ